MAIESSRATAYLKSYNPIALQRMDGLWQWLWQRTSRGVRDDSFAWCCILTLLTVGLAALVYMPLFVIARDWPALARVSGLIKTVALVVWVAFLMFRWSVLWTRRFSPATPDMLKEIIASLTDDRSGWTDIIAGWASTRPFLYKDYARWRHAELIKEKEAKKIARANLRSSARADQTALLATGALGAAMERRRLEQGTRQADDSTDACGIQRL